VNTKIYMLGTGTAVPIRRALPCIALRIDSDIYLFDVGEGCQQRMIKCGLSPVKTKGIFITHLHGDHYLGVFGLLQSMRLLEKKTELVLVAPHELIELIENMIHSGMVRLDFEYDLREIGEGEVYRNNKLSVAAYRVKHGIPSYGYIIRIKEAYTVVYTGDTVPIEKTVEVADRAHLLIHESTFVTADRDEAYKQLHSTAGDAAKIASAAKVRKLVLTHISPRYSDQSEVLYDAYRYFKNVVVAEDYMTIYI